MRRVYRCEITGNPFGTDTWKVGHPCQCQVCSLCTLNAELVAALEEIANHRDLMSDWPHTVKAMQHHARVALAKAKGQA